MLRDVNNRNYSFRYKVFLQNEKRMCVRWPVYWWYFGWIADSFL